VTVSGSGARPRPAEVIRASFRRAAHHARDPSAVLLVCQLIGAAVAFIANIAAARTLEPAGRGELALLLQIAYLSSLGLLLGCDRSVITTYSSRPVSTVARSFVRLLVAPSALFQIVIVAVLALPVPGIASWRTGLVLALLFAVVNAFVRAVRSVAIATGRHRNFLVYSLVSEALMLLALGLLVLTDVRESALWMLAYLVVGTAPTAVLLLLWTRVRPAAVPEDAGAGAAALRTARREGLQILPSALAHSGTLRIDRLLLAGLASTTALGMYASVATMTELIAWPLLAFADSRLGRWREAHDGGTLRLRKLLIATGLYCVAAVAMMTVTLRLILVPLLGPAYEPSLVLVLPLVVAAAVFGVSQILINLLIAVHRGPAASAVEIGGFVVSIVAYVVLIERCGALGAAYGSLLGYATCLIAAGLLLMGRRSR
jgi:O-antigen/teichoic acid export membrane protein